MAGVRARHGIPEGPYLLSVCTFEPRKNLRHVVRSFVELLRAHPELSDLNLVLTGGQGWMFEPILAELAGTALPSGRIITTGYVPDADLAPLYSGAAAFLYLSRYEGFGLPPLEAMQCGTPVIVSEYQQPARSRRRCRDFTVTGRSGRTMPGDFGCLRAPRAARPTSGKVHPAGAAIQLAKKCAADQRNLRSRREMRKPMTECLGPVAAGCQVNLEYRAFGVSRVFSLPSSLLSS